MLPETTQIPLGNDTFIQQCNDCGAFAKDANNIHHWKWCKPADPKWFDESDPMPVANESDPEDILQYADANDLALLQCPYDTVTTCIMDEPCDTCETYVIAMNQGV